MRNWFSSGCDCNNPDPVIGVIVGGKKFPFGTVKQSDYNADMKEVNKQLASLENHISNISQKMEITNSKVETLNKNVLRNSDEIAGVKGTVSSMEASIKASDTRFENISTSLKSITDVLESLDDRVSAIESGEPDPPPTPTKQFYVYWGASAAEVPNTAVVSALPYKTYTDEIARSITVPCTNEYCYYAYPASEGYVQFEVSGFTGGFEDPVDIAVIDGEGNSKVYRVYRSSQILDGTAPIKVKK